MRVPLLDLKPQMELLETEIKAAVNEVLDSTQYVLGERVDRFEQSIAEYCGAKSGIGVTSGTDALLVSLMALDIGPGDLVITTAYSFFATAGTIWRTGARPVFVDIDPASYNIDPDALRSWFEENPAQAKNVKAIMAVHLYGQCADMDAIAAIAAERNLPIVEDAAQSIGATYPGKDGTRQAGTMGIAGCFSFFPSKNLGGVGDGGMVVTSDQAFADRVRRLRNHGMEPKYYHPEVGGNFRLDPIQAAVLQVKLPHLNEWHAQRRENASYYDEHINTPGIVTPETVYGREHHIYNQYIIRVPERRDELRAFLNEREIGHDVYYPVPFHLQECFREMGHHEGDFPESERAAGCTLALPVYPELTRAMQDHVVQALADFYGG